VTHLALAGSEYYPARNGVTLHRLEAVGGMLDDIAELRTFVRIVAAGSLSGAPKDSDLVMRKLADNYRIVVAAPDYLERRGTPVVPEDLTRHECLLYRGPETHWSLVGPAGKAVELRVASRMRCNSGEVAHDWALAGCGLIMKSWVDVAPDVQAGRLVRVLPEWRSEPTPVCGLFPSSPRLPLRVRLFLEAMVARLASVEALPLHSRIS
jgi:DNA-binding transcriptional LysR family regulator